MWEWCEPGAEGLEPYAGLILMVPEEEKLGERRLRYGDLLNALVGVNWIRLRWPMLDFNCRVLDEESGGMDIGFLSFYFEE